MGLHRRSRPPSMDGLSVPTGFARIWRAAGEKMVGSIHLPPPPKDTRIQSLSALCREDIKGLKPLDWGNLQPSSRATLNCAPFLPLGQDCAPAPKIPPRWASWVHSSVKNSSPEPTVETWIHCVSFCHFHDTGPVSADCLCSFSLCSCALFMHPMLAFQVRQVLSFWSSIPLC